MSDAMDPEVLLAGIEGLGAEYRCRVRMQRELTPSVRRALLEYAQRRERMVVGAGGRGSDGEASAWVADALGDTVLGDIAWPEEIDLLNHIRGVIRSRTAKLARAAQRRPHLSLDDAGHKRDALVTAIGADRSAEATEAAHELDEVIRFVAAMAPDADVVALARAYRDGAETVGEAGERAGLTVAATRAARRRLDRVLAKRAKWQVNTAMADSGTW